MVPPIANDHILPNVQGPLSLSSTVLLAVIYLADPILLAFSMYHLASHIARFICRVTFKIFWLLGLALVLLNNGMFFVIITFLIWIPGAVLGYILDGLEEIWSWIYPRLLVSPLQSVAPINDVLWEIDRTTDISDLELSPEEEGKGIEERNEVGITLYNGGQLCPSENISALELDEDEEILELELLRAVLATKEDNEGEERGIKWAQRDAYKLTKEELENKVEEWMRGIEEAGELELWEFCGVTGA